MITFMICNFLILDIFLMLTNKEDYQSERYKIYIDFLTLVKTVSSFLFLNKKCIQN